jgi:NAD-dependent dihydropyrimidine dehydrogenase PreA subunit
MKKNHYVEVNSPTMCNMLYIDEKKCTGCNTCIEICRVDLFHPNPIPGNPPIVPYPDECWLCGNCVEHCKFGAIKLCPPMTTMIAWKRKVTGEIFRIGLNEPPEAYTVPPIIGMEL